MNKPSLTDFANKLTQRLKQCPGCYACQIPVSQTQCDDCHDFEMNQEAEDPRTECEDRADDYEVHDMDFQDLEGRNYEAMCNGMEV